MTAHWHCSANHTHLYPGARLRVRDDPGPARLAAGDWVDVEFSDGIVACGQILHAAAGEASLARPEYRTRHATRVTARTWTLVPGPEDGLIRVQRRLAPA